MISDWCTMCTEIPFKLAPWSFDGCTMCTEIPFKVGPWSFDQCTVCTEIPFKVAPWSLISAPVCAEIIFKIKVHEWMNEWKFIYSCIITFHTKPCVFMISDGYTMCTKISFKVGPWSLMGTPCVLKYPLRLVRDHCKGAPSVLKYPLRLVHDLWWVHHVNRNTLQGWSMIIITSVVCTIQN